MVQKSVINPTEVKLKELYLLSRTGDQEAYRQFLELCSDVTGKFLSYISRGQNLKNQIDDVRQEVLYKIHTKKHTYREEHPILPWIHAVIRYTYIDYYRKQGRLKEVEAVPEMRDVEKEEVDGVYEILDLLTPEQRQLIEAISIEGKTFAEVAREMNTKEGTLRVRYHRLINELKARLVP